MKGKKKKKDTLNCGRRWISQDSTAKPVSEPVVGAGYSRKYIPAGIDSKVQGPHGEIFNTTHNHRYQSPIMRYHLALLQWLPPNKQSSNMWNGGDIVKQCNHFRNHATLLCIASATCLSNPASGYISINS